MKREKNTDKFFSKTFCQIMYVRRNEDGTSQRELVGREGRGGRLQGNEASTKFNATSTHPGGWWRVYPKLNVISAKCISAMDRNDFEYLPERIFDDFRWSILPIVVSDRIHAPSESRSISVPRFS